MPRRIERDLKKFKEIIYGKIRKDLKKYIKSGEMIGKVGKDLVSIPIHGIDIPNFRYGPPTEGIGSGDGDIGKIIGRDGQEGAGGAGDTPGEHIPEVELSIEELAKILGEELELPDIKDKGKKNIVSEKLRYRGARKAGIEPLRIFKRTFQEALKRALLTGEYNPDDENSIIVPIKEDTVYRSHKLFKKPEINAVIIDMMDVSGSMGDAQKEIVRICSFWKNAWLKTQYKGVENVYIIHDAAAREVDEETFYHTREDGGTVISSAYELCLKIISERYNPAEWNIYGFHWSDGDNYSTDNDKAIGIIKEGLLPVMNLFAYGQVQGNYGTGAFMGIVFKQCGHYDNIALADIPNKDGIYDVLKKFLGKGV